MSMRFCTVVETLFELFVRIESMSLGVKPTLTVSVTVVPSARLPAVLTTKLKFPVAVFAPSTPLVVQVSTCATAAVAVAAALPNATADGEGTVAGAGVGVTFHPPFGAGRR